MVGGMSEAINDRAKLMMHRLIARQIRMRPELLKRARIRMGEPSQRELSAAEEWRQILRRDADIVARLLCERSERMYRLRLSSPFIGVIDFSDPNVRRRIHRLCRDRLVKQNHR
ncbi:hypothetical protein BOO69_07305 [Sulfitobacter alexandrii]|uniref:Uncharacterized protein n=1 Tax=Sulfitobacter alexandrii TaxID=1917485 RepID=A0A1J0WFX5_9RHOB|nr:hypothetical protein BOO69_07305 [Sulfitobacter alexandrii]